MNENIFEAVKSQVESIIFNRELDTLSGYVLSFPDYMFVINTHKSLYQTELKAFISHAITNRIQIDKNSVGYDFLNDRLGHLSNKKLKTKNTENITPELLSQEVIEKRKVGRPKGSKNIVKMNIPQHEIIDSQIISAVQDIIWYKPGMLAIEIVSQLKYDNSIEKLIYAKLHEYANVHWKKYVVKLPKSKSIERYYPIKDRSGYYYNGELLSLGEISKITGKSKQILSYRIKKGMNHIEAINTQIKENMIRKNPGQ